VLVVVDEGQHVSRQEVSFLCCSSKKCRSHRVCPCTRRPSINEEGLTIVGTYQPINNLEVCSARGTVSPNHHLVVVVEVDSIGDGAARRRPVRRLVAEAKTSKVFQR
jgi:hypothetical protein